MYKATVLIAVDLPHEMIQECSSIGESLRAQYFDGDSVRDPEVPIGHITLEYLRVSSESRQEIEEKMQALEGFLRSKVEGLQDITITLTHAISHESWNRHRKDASYQHDDELIQEDEQIRIDVRLSDELLQLQQELVEFAKKNHWSGNYLKREFHPHVTVLWYRYEADYVMESAFDFEISTDIYQPPQFSLTGWFKKGSKRTIRKIDETILVKT